MPLAGAGESDLSIQIHQDSQLHVRRQFHIFVSSSWPLWNVRVYQQTKPALSNEENEKRLFKPSLQTNIIDSNEQVVSGTNKTNVLTNKSPSPAQESTNSIEEVS